MTIVARRVRVGAKGREGAWRVLPINWRGFKLQIARRASLKRIQIALRVKKCCGAL